MRNRTLFSVRQTAHWVPPRFYGSAEGLQIKTFFISVYEAVDGGGEGRGGGGGGIFQGRSVPSSPSVTTPKALIMISEFKVIPTGLN